MYIYIYIILRPHLVELVCGGGYVGTPLLRVHCTLLLRLHKSKLLVLDLHCPIGLPSNDGIMRH